MRSRKRQWVPEMRKPDGARGRALGRVRMQRVAGVAGGESTLAGEIGRQTGAVSRIAPPGLGSAGSNPSDCVQLSGRQEEGHAGTVER